MTYLAVIEPTEHGLVLREVAPSVTVQQVAAATEAKLIIPERVPEMGVTEEAEALRPAAV